MPLTKTWADRVLRAVLHGEAMPVVRETWVGLLSELPSDEMPEGVEFDAASYERVRGAWRDPDGGVLTNANDMAWPRALEDWGEALGFAVYDAPEGGEMVMWGKHDRPKQFEAVDQAFVLPGDYRVRIS
jgi:hypothetical protein